MENTAVNWLMVQHVELAKKASNLATVTDETFKAVAKNLKHQKHFNRLCVIFAAACCVNMYLDYRHDKAVEKQLKELKQMNGE